MTKSARLTSALSQISPPVKTYVNSQAHKSDAFHIIGPKSMSSATDDRTLLATYRAGSDEAFSHLVIRYQALVMNACHRQVTSEQLEDCVQAVFMVLARRPAAAMRAPALAAWLHRVCHFVCRNARRTTKRREAIMMTSNISPAVAAQTNTDPDDILLIQLDAALLQLGDRQRAALLLHAENKSAPEIAERLGVSTANAHKLIQRGLSTLRQHVVSNKGKSISSATLLGFIYNSALSASIQPVPSSAALLASATNSSAAALLAQGATVQLTIITIKTAVIAAVLPVAVCVIGILSREVFFSTNQQPPITQELLNSVARVATVTEISNPPQGKEDEERLVALEKEASLIVAKRPHVKKKELLKKIVSVITQYDAFIPHDEITKSIFYVGSHADDKIMQERELALRTVLATWVAEAPEQAVRWVHALPNRQDRDAVLNFVVEKWTKKEPEKALAWAQKLSELEECNDVLATIFATWAKTEPEKAFASATALPIYHMKRTAAEVTLVCWAEKEPAKVATFIHDIYDNGDKIPLPLLKAIAKHFILFDEKNALDWYNTLPHNSNKMIITVEFVSSWVTKNPRGAFAWLEENVPEHYRAAFRAWILGVWATHDLEQATAYAAELRTQHQQLPKLDIRFLEKLVYENFEYAAAYALTLPDAKERSDCRCLIPLLLSKYKLDQAMEMLHSIDFTDMPSSPLVDMARSLAEKDYKSAKKIIPTLDIEVQQFAETALENIIMEVAAHNPEPLVAWFDSLPQTERVALLGPMLSGWLGKNPTAAKAWVEQLRDIKEREFANKHIIPVLVQPDPDRALSLALPIKNKPDKQSAMIALASSWIAISPENAINKITSLPQDSARDELLGYVVLIWALYEPENVMQWFKANSDRTVNTIAVNQIVSALRIIDIKGAADFVLQIETHDEQEKITIITGVVLSWCLKNDIHGAKLWTDKLPPGKVKNAAYGMIVDRMGLINPEEAAEMALSLDDNGYGEMAVNNVASRLVDISVEKTLSWMNELKSPILRIAATKGLIRGLSYAGPDKAHDWLKSQKEKDQRKSAIYEFMINWVYFQHNMHSAANFATKLEVEDERNWAIYNLLHLGIKQYNDSRQVLSLLDLMNPSDHRNSAILLITKWWQKLDHAAAVKWATGLTNADEKSLACTAIKYQWAQADSDKANKWFQDLHVPEHKLVTEQAGIETKPKVETFNEF